MACIGGEISLKRKWWMLLVGVIVAVFCLSGVGAYFFIAGRFAPPVDISGIDIASALTVEELLPDQLISGSLDRGTLYNGSMLGIRDGVEYNATKTSAEYNGMTLRVLKAETEVGASMLFERYYDDPFEEHVSGWAKKTKTIWWFTFEGGGTSGFAWISGVWVFGVEAENSEVRNQAAAEWVQELRLLSS